ncbi:choice-of-anchor P family protein [Streptosporangium sp. NPDC000239]|uniref:choice-of-anchor P family protein n=1 Tax=Streptosporangium sp. NPDC000239 TaxID=3154248 RepID=UPI00332EB1A5
MPARRHIGAIGLLAVGLLTAVLPATPSSAAVIKATAYGVWAQGALSAGPLPHADSAAGPTSARGGPWVLGKPYMQILSAQEFHVAAQRQSTSLWADAQVKGILAFGRTIEVENLSASCASTGTGIRSEVRMGRNHFGNSVAGEGVIPAPERITFDGGSAVVNEQQVRASDGTLTVNALHITMNSGPSFILGSVTCTRLA